VIPQLTIENNNKVHDVDHHHHISPRGHCCNLDVTPVALMLALSIHACLEGIALGLLETKESTINLCIGIILHKIAASFSLAIELKIKYGDRHKIMGLILAVFAIATPLGVVIGLAAKNSSPLVDVIFSSLAAGTFVYIAATEIVNKEFSKPEHRWLKLLVFFIGAAIVTGLLFLE